MTAEAVRRRRDGTPRGYTVPAGTHPSRVPFWHHWMFAAAAAVVAFVVRAVGITRANDLFIDEVTYAQLASAVSQGHLPNQSGVLFFLHPPGSFLLNGAVIKIGGLSGSPMDLVYDLRWVNVVLGSAMVLLAFLIVRRIATTPIALVAATVLAFDPFVLRNDTRVMLETPAMVALLAGWLVLFAAMERPASRSTSLLEVISGLLLGLALITKDMTFIPAVGTLLVAMLWRHTQPALRAGRVAVAIGMPYLIYLDVLGFNGVLPQWWDAKTSGVSRMIGLAQTTGFNAHPHVSLASRLVDEVPRFGTSYLLLGLCAFAGAAAALSVVPARRFVGLIAVNTAVLGLYAVLVGAAEEQFGYYVLVASVLALSATAAELLDRRPGLRQPVTIISAVFVTITIVLGITARLTVDDGYRQVRAWMNGQLPANSRVGLTGVTAEFAFLPHAGYDVWPSLSSLEANHADYVLTESHPLSEGYGYAAPALLDWLAQHARPVFDSYGPSNGHTVIWRLDPAAMAQAVARGDDIPPVNGGYR
ncbi:MAG: ArnT family glycosyltransferase [Pseudonocardiaceae bacterium]